MKVRFLVGLLCMIVGQESSAQTLWFFPEKGDTLKHTLLVTSYFDVNANTLPNKMTRKLLFGGFMSADFLQEMRGKLNERNNRAGNEFKNVAVYRWAQKKHSWSIGIKYRELFGLHYTKDLFGLVFLGNGAYEGQNASISTTQYTFWNYTGCSAGWLKPLNEGKSGQLYLGVSALYGFSYQHVKSGDASLYTAPDAQYVQLDADFTLQYSKPGNGIGAGLDIGYSKNWNKSLFRVQVEDLGFMNWQNMTTYQANGSYSYHGEKIENVLNFNGDSLFSDYSATGFAHRFGIVPSKGSKTVLLPFSINLKYSRAFSDKWAGSLQLYYTHLPAYLPRATLRAERLFQHRWKTSLGLGYGGFGRGNVLLGVEKGMGRNWAVNVESYFLGMAFLPNNGHGLGVNLGIKSCF